MKETIVYGCEICGNTSTDKAYIENCEARGVRDPAEVPVGCLFYAPGFYGKCVFVAAKVEAGLGCFNAHCLRIACWATRDGFAGDNIGKDAPTCGGADFYQKGKPSYTLPDIPAAKRMLEALEKMGIKPTIWDGWKAVPLEDYK
jgi:hypothetical protein